MNDHDKAMKLINWLADCGGSIRRDHGAGNVDLIIIRGRHAGEMATAAADVTKGSPVTYLILAEFWAKVEEFVAANPRKPSVHAAGPAGRTEAEKKV